MKYVQGPMTTEIIVPAQTVDSLCPLSPALHSHPRLEWLMPGTDGKMRPLNLLAEQGEGQCLMDDMRMNINLLSHHFNSCFLMIRLLWIRIIIRHACILYVRVCICSCIWVLQFIMFIIFIYWNTVVCICS